MRTEMMLRVLIVGTALLSSVPFAQAADPETRESLEQRLRKEYPLTKLTADRTGIVTPGAVLTLKKDGFLMVPSTSALVCNSQYKGGKISIGLVGRALCEKGVPGRGGSTRKFVAGEKLNVIRIEVKESSVVFDLYSVEAYSDLYYRGILSFPIEKGVIPPAGEVIAISGQVFSVEGATETKTSPSPSQPSAGIPQSSNFTQPGTQPGAGQPAPDPAPAKRFEDIPEPTAPPAKAPPPNLKLGLTLDQIVAQLGKAASSETVGDKQIYLFKDWKITFMNGVVTDIDPR